MYSLRPVAFNYITFAIFIFRIIFLIWKIVNINMPRPVNERSGSTWQHLFLELVDSLGGFCPFSVNLYQVIIASATWPRSTPPLPNVSHPGLLFFVPKSATSIGDLDQAVAFAVGLFALLISLYSALYSWYWNQDTWRESNHIELSRWEKDELHELRLQHFGRQRYQPLLGW
ncbi:hypothetical protein BCR34DRAFT_382270 [Clohesyomyces aquaticus]|uniref:Uncharacterized protein n=1 Tax=Clohesyomyces aquaticus TaxID=1231657 RepID=A0A1Y1ZGM3_9PLEO|nr:hypothetical protein BCR34DRAFT_382270 [Clohesyomyces aquaticus]